MPIYNTHFGVELECYLPEGGTMRAAAQAVSQRIGEPVSVEDYNHSLRPSWKVVTDGSLSDYSRGCEFVSPKLNGEAGIAQLEAVCEALVDYGCTVSRRCGMHVHVDAGGQGLGFFKKLVRLYQVYEPVIDQLMPPSRRASANGFCRSITAVPAANIDSAASVQDLTMVIHRATGAGEPRYHKVNLAAYSRHSTVEFRQHSGTLDARKAANWVKICLRLVATAKRDDLALATPARAQINRARRGTKAHRIGEMLLRQEGASGPEICREMGWPSVSVPAQARAAGIDVISQRMGREVRYYARRATAEAPTTLDVSLGGFCQLIGTTEAERTYLEQRARNLSGPVAWAA